MALGTEGAAVRPTTSAIPEGGPFLLIYHFFYPADDEARKRNTIYSTNREGHHLAVGLLLQGDRDDRHQAAGWVSHVLVSRGPDSVQVIPFNHPVLTRLMDDGTESAKGLHTVLYSVWRSPLALLLVAGAGGAAALATGAIAKAAGAGDEYVVALSILAGIAGSALASGVWPVAAAAIIIFLIVLLMCIFTGCGSDDHDVFEGEPTPGSAAFTLRSNPEYQDPNSYVAPGSATPGGIQAVLRLIPHVIDRNLYGLHGGGEDKFTIEDNRDLMDLLGWVAFPGGLGYPVDREFPGREDIPGSSWRNYFDIFVEKLLDVERAQGQVKYFGS